MTKETIIKIPSVLFAPAESSVFEGKLELNSLKVGPDEYIFAKPIDWKIELTNTGQSFLIQGTARAEGKCECSRCLDEVVHSFNGDIEGLILIDGENAKIEDIDDEEIGEDEFEILNSDHTVDFMPYIQSALIFDAPYKPLCSPDCKGICLNCGANLNKTECNCKDSDTDVVVGKNNPFGKIAYLKDILENNESQTNS